MTLIEGDGTDGEIILYLVMCTNDDCSRAHQPVELMCFVPSSQDVPDVACGACGAEISSIAEVAPTEEEA